MDTMSPARKQAYSLLRNEICMYLEGAEELSQLDWYEQEAEQVRKVIPDLVTIIRGMMVLHEVVNNGNCKTCSQPWPCSITETIHTLVKDPERTFGAILISSRHT